MKIGSMKKIITFYIKQMCFFNCAFTYSWQNMCVLCDFSLNWNNQMQTKTPLTYSLESTTQLSDHSCHVVQLKRLFSLPLLAQVPNCLAQPSAGLSLVYKMCLLKREIPSDSLKENPFKKITPQLCLPVKYNVLLLLPYQQIQEPRNRKMSQN